jgi:hypothetical protein
MRRKTANPAEIALRDKLAKAAADFERWYRRLQRAARACDRSHKAIGRFERKLAALQGDNHP